MTATSASASCGLAAGLSLWGSSFASALAWWAIARTASASSQHAQPGAMPARRQAHAPAQASRQLKAHAYCCPGGRPVAAAAVVCALQRLPSFPVAQVARLKNTESTYGLCSKARSRRGFSAALPGAWPEMRLTAQPSHRGAGRGGRCWVPASWASAWGLTAGAARRCSAARDLVCAKVGARVAHGPMRLHSKLRFTLDCYKRTAAPGGGGFFVLAKQVSRKERTQKRHKTIRSKVSEYQLHAPGSCALLARLTMAACRR